MATPTYSQSDFYSHVNGMMHGKFGTVQDRQITSNRAVRYVLNDLDMRSTKRSSQLAPNLFDDIYDYAAPADLKSHKVIDIKKQVNRDPTDGFILVDEADFDRYKTVTERRIAIKDANFTQILRIDGIEGSSSLTIHNCDSVTANGTWAATSDASNLTADSDNYIRGSASLNFDMAAGTTTGYIENSTMTQVDLTDYDETGSIFLWVFIPDYSDAEGDTVTNFILRWGNDSSNYWSRTVTTNNEGLTFYDGWNLLRFDWNGATETGTVVPSTIDYLRFTVTKSASLAADTDWRIDDITVRKGDIYDVIYYTKYGWQSSTGTYKEESTTTTDLLIADTEEIEGLAFKAAEFASQELKEYDDVKYFKQEYLNWKARYEYNYHSEALKLHNSYYSTPRRSIRWR